MSNIPSSWKAWRFSFYQFVVLEWSPLKVDLLTTESTPTFNADVSILLLRRLLLRLLLMCQKILTNTWKLPIKSFFFWSSILYYIKLCRVFAEISSSHDIHSFEINFLCGYHWYFIDVRMFVRITYIILSWTDMKIGSKGKTFFTHEFLNHDKNRTHEEELTKVVP